MLLTDRDIVKATDSNVYPLKKWDNILLLFIIFFSIIFTSGCKLEVYKGLTEDQVNEMVATLIYRGIDAEKSPGGKEGFSLLVAEEQLISALEILKKNALPRENYVSLGEVFSGQGMISSQSEERARMAYAISQELANTFSRIDGVLTTRVHVVPGYTDQAVDSKILPSMGIFIRHTPDSPVVNMLPSIREVAAKSLPDLEYDRTSVMLLPVQEPLTIPSMGSSTFLGISLFPERGSPYFLIGMGIIFLAIIFGIFFCIGLVLFQKNIPIAKKIDNDGSISGEQTIKPEEQ
ncbi:EscJ/YscJ/HrcJ family type III secretion inner membrane ring protein [Lawsonia intracellularis]|uniref:type III secretion system inner membrane ring lipoprotein SctJ n=1 Tax=Lawsonia intracellularis TaxID=29546 RepID=UPI000976717E|nr:type III secretion inner membrane ring lipoprotein SctJ [Lawsonia intracellularis]OMQ04718.1 EscJ/YscJ/HrcJ family type III secretion inner membrane ring protein [Lawsonia intracellularis]